MDNGIKSDNLDFLVVRPIFRKEAGMWDELMRAHHYLGFNILPGKSLKYVALLDGQWVALLGWGAAALKNGPREKWLGWSLEQKTQRLNYVVNNQRFLILPGVDLKNLASKALALNTKRLCADWQAAFDYPVLLAETFVNHSRFNGTCYRAAGWLPLGKTSGYGRQGGTYYYHGETKTVLVKPLRPDVQKLLSAPFLSPEITGEKAVLDLNTVFLTGENGLLDYLAQVPDPRKKRGIRHKNLVVLAIAACAILSGMTSFIAIAQWAGNLTQDLLKRLDCRRHPKTGIYIPPSEPTIRRLLQAVDADKVDQSLGSWLKTQVTDGAIAVDGKTLKGASIDGEKVHLLSVFLQKQKITIGQVQVDKKSNEITAFRPLLEPLKLAGKVVTADAMHTQVKNALFLVEEKKADYLFQVKQNQGSLFEAIRNLPPEVFTPKLTTLEKGHGRIEKRGIQSTTAVEEINFPYVAQVILVYREFTKIKTGKVSTDTSFYITSLFRDKADSERLLELIRNHWSIENSSHYVRDVTFD
jgi:predicted transposase YbfD/YdcC